MFKQRFLTIGLILSLLIHLVYLYLLIPRGKIEIPQQQVLVELIKELPQQIVESPESNNQQSDAKLLSEQDNKVERQSKKDGDSPKVKPPTPKMEKQVPAQKKEKPTDKVDKNEFAEVKKEARTESKPQKKINLFDSSIMNEKPGTLDKLNDIPSGNITLLNTKANKFAGFVRRIVTDVFNDIKRNYVPLLESRSPISTNGFAKFSTRLDKSGKQISNILKTSDLEIIIKNIVAAAIKEYANDPNPPPDAISASGTYDFEFEFYTKRNGNVITYELGVSLN